MRSLLFAIAFSVSTPAALSDVVIVDVFGGTGFTVLQDAVDAASDGDTVRILSLRGFTHEFANCVVDGKSLSIVGPSKPVRVESITVSNLSSTQIVNLSNLASLSGSIFENNEGAIFLRECQLWLYYGPPGKRNVVRSCRSVTFLGCVLRGQTGESAAMSNGDGRLGGIGLELENSRVALYGGTFDGGSGGEAFYDYYGTANSNGGPGGVAVSVTDSELYLGGVAVRGGSGGSVDTFAYNGSGGDGGSGLLVSPGSSVLRRDSVITPGAGGFGPTQGTPGAATVGSIVTSPGQMLPVDVPRFALHGEEVVLRLRGEPGREVLWAASEGMAWKRLGVRPGVLHVPGPIRRIANGVIPPCGEWTVTYRVPPASANSGLGLMLQAAVQTSDGSVQLHAPAFLPTVSSLGHPDCGMRMYVDVDAPAGGNGLSWATAHDDLMAALASAPLCAEHTLDIWIAEGSYYPDSPGGNPGQRFKVRPGMHLYGGFAGIETHLRDRDPTRHPVVLSGDLDRNDDQGIRSDNCFTVVDAGKFTSVAAAGTPSVNVVLDGLIIEGGESNYSAGGIVGAGELELRDCTIRDCYARRYAAGIDWRGGDLRIVGCRIVGNRVSLTEGFSTWGAGVEVFASLERSTHLSMIDTLIQGNSGGPALRLALSSSPTSVQYPASTYSGFQAEIRHCTFAANMNPFGTAGLVASDIFLNVSNTVLWGNLGSAQASLQLQQLDLPNSSDLGYLCVEGLEPTLAGPGHIGLDPLFVDPLGTDGIPATLDDDFRLGFGSPCVDAGSNARSACDTFDLDRDGDRNERLLTDLDGGRRFQDDPSAPDMGTAPVIDMGALERKP